MIYCPKCKQHKPAEAFSKCSGRSNGKHGHCKACKAAYSKAWSRANRDIVNARARDYGQRMRAKLIEEYGGKCNCCGEARYEFLALDHVNGGGTRERYIGKHGRWTSSMKPIAMIVKREGYPKDGRYQILCHNCNMAKGFYGACPHTKELSLYETTKPYGLEGRSCDRSERSTEKWAIQ